jgi:hypothetical protein
MLKNMATDIYLYRKDRRWQKASKVIEVTLSELDAWSSEYRDIFGNTTNLFAGLGTNSAGGSPFASSTTFSAAAAVIPSSFTGGSLTSNTVGTYAGGLSVRGTNDLSTAISDEINHEPLRQTSLKRSFWKFDRGASAAPRYLYAEYLQGDQILDNPPETI